MSENEKKTTIQNIEWKLEKLKERSDEIYKRIDEINNMLRWYVEAYSLLEFEIKQLRGK